MKRLSCLVILLLCCLVLFDTGTAYAKQKVYNTPFIPPFEISQESIQAKTKITEYNGKIYHIFFHSLILEPKLAFKSSMKEGYNNWMTTRTEFKKILNTLFKNNFILIDINSLVTSKGTKSPLYLPQGKKPLIISIDDVNYYDYMKNCGFSDRLIALKDGSIACIKKTKSNEILDYQGDVMPIVDEFVKTHPEFSFKGAKGIVAVTGFQGVFGYRLYDKSNNKIAHNIEQAKKVANALKRNGWKIACHSYSHSNRFKDVSISLERFINDLKKWETQIAPVTGKTNIYISPFGTSFLSSDNRMQHLKNMGYNIFCPVYKNMGIKYENNMLISERLNFDGFTMIKYPSRIKKHFFDPAAIIDPARPKMR